MRRRDEGYATDRENIVSWHLRVVGMGGIPREIIKVIRNGREGEAGNDAS